MTLTASLAHALEPVANAQPTGENLEYSDAFIALFTAAKGKEERQIGDLTIPAEDPHWHDVAESALSLLGQSKDVRIAVLLTNALLKTDGARGFAEGLGLVHGLLERYWDDLHPQRETNDDNLIRLNALAALNHPESTLRDLRGTPLLSVVPFGEFSLRTVEEFERDAKAPLNGAQSLNAGAELQSAVAACALEMLDAQVQTLECALHNVTAIDACLQHHVATTATTDFDALRAVLSKMLSVTRGWLLTRQPSQSPASGESPSPQPLQRAQSGVLRNHADVIDALNRVCDYFEQNEPSSPVPLLVRRARRLVSKDFMAIIEDLSPDTVARIQSISGEDRHE